MGLIKIKILSFMINVQSGTHGELLEWCNDDLCKFSPPKQQQKHW